MGWGIGDLFNPISAVQDTFSGLASLPGTPEAFGAGIYGGLNGDLSWNPYSQDNSVWDTGAGGTELSQDPNNRRYGRQIGTAIGAAFTGGALGSLGTDASLAADGTTVSGIAADGTAGAAGEGSSSLASGIAGGAERGAAVNAAATAAQGGNLSDIAKGGIYGGISGGLGTGISDSNPGSYVSSDPQYQKIINSGLTSAGNNTIRGGSTGMGFLTGAGTPALNLAGSNITSSLGGSSVPDSSYAPQSSGPASDYFNNMFSQSQAPQGWSNSPEVNSSLGVNTDSSLYNPNFNSDTSAGPTMQKQSVSNGGNPLLTMAMSAIGGNGQGQGGLGNTLGSLAGMYQAYQQKKRLGGLADGLNGLYSPNSPYAQQLSQSLDRRDAAAGRRSQYGSRAVELQANLAGLNAHMAPTLQGLYSGQQTAGNQLLNNGLQLGRSSGLTGYLGSSLFNGASSAVQPWMAPFMNGPMGQPNVGPQLGE